MVLRTAYHAIKIALHLADSQNQFILRAHADFCPVRIREALHAQIDSFCHTLEKAAEDIDPLSQVERELKAPLFALGALFLQYFFAVVHQHLEASPDRRSGRIRRRQIYTFYGPVVFWRRGKQGLFPLDTLLGIPKSQFSLFLTFWFAQKVTLCSYATAAELFHCDHGWKPSIPSIRRMAFGVSEYASPYMRDPRFTPPIPLVPGNRRIILQIQADGKGFPTVREKELEKRRNKASRTHAERAADTTNCQCEAAMGSGKGRCPRHRNRDSRSENPKEKKKRGDKSKNARSATLVNICLLIEGEDGKLHGPVARRVWASLGPRKQMLEWAREEVIRRGFDPDGENLQILIDGERCLELECKKRFPNAEFSLDIRHAEEYIWCAGRQFEKEGSAALEQWVQKHLKLLRAGETAELARRIRISMGLRSKEGAKNPLSKAQCEKIEKTLEYLEKRTGNTEYNRLQEKDLDISTGQVEGAARNYVGQRLDEGGMRWSEKGGQSILQLRCIVLNGEWESFVEYAEEEIHEKWLKSGTGTLLSSEGTKLCP